MITHRRQSGMSIFGILGILLMLGFFALCIIRMTPPYFEFLTVRDIVKRIALEPETAQASTGDLRRKLYMIYHTNQIYEANANEVKIFNRSGKRYIDARYEVRIPILWRIDAVLKFDDLAYEVGNPIPVTSIPKAL
jgi:hypothetical protein